MNIVVDLSLWSALKLCIAGIANYIANEKDKKVMGEIEEIVAEIREIARKPKQATKKDIMCISKVDLRKAYNKSGAFWLITLHVTNPNCMLSHAKAKIADTIRSTYNYPVSIDVVFIVQEDNVGYDTGVDELINGNSHALIGADLLKARMVQEKHEGECFECVGVKVEK